MFTPLQFPCLITTEAKSELLEHNNGYKDCQGSPAELTEVLITENSILQGKMET